MPSLYLTLFILSNRTGLRFGNRARLKTNSSYNREESYARAAIPVYQAPRVILDVLQMCVLMLKFLPLIIAKTNEHGMAALWYTIRL